MNFGATVCKSAGQNDITPLKQTVMKNLIQKATLVLGVVLIAFTACKKEDFKRVATATEDIELSAIANQASSDMISQDATDDSPEYGVARLDEGIAYDYLAEAADMDEVEEPAGNDDQRDLRKNVRNHSFIACLRKLDLSERQIMGVKKSLMKYEDCKESAVKRARAIHQKLVEQYKAKFERLHKAFRNGDITEREFKQAVHKLRESFNKELRELQIKEKLDAAFQHCYREFLGNLKSILTERQWKAFVNCHKR